MNAMEIQRQGVQKLSRMGTQRSRKCILLKLMVVVMVSILLPTFALPDDGDHNDGHARKVKTAKVPNVIGLNQTAAEAAIVAVRLRVGTITTAPSTTVSLGTVISQDPRAGSKVKVGSAVDLVVSLGVAVPNMVGSPQATAQTALATAGLIVGTVTTANSPTVPIGHVIGQTPTAGTNVAPGSAVALVVSLGAKVPNVVGSPQATAQTALTMAGLAVGTLTTVNNPTVPIGRVISQNPNAGTNVAPGSAVDLVMSLGLAVPNVVGNTQAAAQTALTSAALAVGTVTSAPSTTMPAGNVIRQTPTAGTNVSPGSAVALVISSGPPVFLMGVQNDPAIGPLVNSLYRIQTDGVVTKIGDLDHRTHGLAFVGSALYSVEELTLSPLGTPPNLYTLNPDTGVTRLILPLTLSTGEAVEGTRGLATDPDTNQLWALLIVPSEVNTFTRLVTINPITGLATQIAKISGRLVDMAFDAAGTLYAIADNRPVLGGSPVLPARIYQLNRTTGEATEFLDVSADAVAGQPNFRESETIGAGFSSDLIYHLSGQNKSTSFNPTKNILFETIHLTTKARTSIPITGPDFFVTTALALAPPDSTRALGDLDASGTADLVWRNTDDGNTAIWLMNGMAIAASGFPGGVPMAWQIAGVGDVNGDGQADVIWREDTRGTVAVWLMNGVTITAVGFPGSTSTDWQMEGVGDVDGNGTADIVWRNSNGVVATWLMNGTTIASTGFLGGVSAQWKIEGIGDVNGDGKADVVWLHSTTGTVALWLMNGMTITAVDFPGSTSTDWQIEGVGDVNGDGKADLIWKNATTGVVIGWLMDGATIESSGVVGSLTSDQALEQVGDMNGDGKADVVLMNKTTGAVEVWLMNGLNITSVGSPDTVSTDWEIQN